MNARITSAQVAELLRTFGSMPADQAATIASREYPDGARLTSAPGLITVSTIRKTAQCTSAEGTVTGHLQCAGYIAPLVYGDTRPCACSCHEPDAERGTHPLAARDYTRAIREAQNGVRR